MPIRLLVVEDQAPLRRLLELAFRPPEFETRLAPDGEAAVREAGAFRPDVMVLDMMLPQRSGLEVLVELRADPSLSAIKVIMLSARTQLADREAASRAGAHAFMAKPFEIPTLRKRIRELAA